MAEELEGSAFFDTPVEDNLTRDSGFLSMNRTGLSTVSVTEVK